MSASEQEPFAEAPMSASGEPFAEVPLSASEQEPFAEPPLSASEESFAEAPKSASEEEQSAEARKSALASDYAALYAVAGLTDALAEALKGALADTQQKASKRINELQSRRPGLSKPAKSGAVDLRTFVITLPEQFKHLPDTTKARIAELQRQANDLLAQATSTYGELAGRGKQAVDEVRRSARDRSSKATKPVTPRGPDRSSESGTGTV
jgi:hypothetical protein